MKVFEYEQVLEFQGKYDLVPICKEIYADLTTPIVLLRRIAAKNDQYFLLESVENGTQIGRYSFLGYAPEKRLYCKKDQVICEEEGTVTELGTEPLSILKRELKQYRAPKIEGMPPFTGGFTGYFSYELIGIKEPKLSLKESEFPVYDLMLFDQVIVFDHLMQKLLLIANVRMKDGKEGYERALRQIEKMEELMYETAPLPQLEAQDSVTFTSNRTKEEFCQMVEQTKKYIYEGEIFQAVISRRFEAEYKGSLLQAYRVMRSINPSPYMYMIKCKEIEIAGVSPETLVRLVDGTLTTFPVAGTRPRGASLAEDLALEKELLEDDKELAEHNMLVDLARNDIGRLSKFGTVEVEEYMKIHRFSKVMHIASVVTGQIEDDKDQVDTIATVLPAGTLSEAPKFRACEIIAELEDDDRGVYAGAIGYLDFSGNLDVCIGIRTAVKKQDKVYVQAGAGIVADSVPEKEYEETYHKARAVMEAIERASEVNGR